MSAILHLPLPVLDALHAVARAGYPHETCGLLIGQREEPQYCRVHSMHPARNLNRERARDRYELDPADYLAAEQAARDAGLDVVGVWHTHPDHPAVPSETDRAAAWEGWSYLILSVSRDGVAAVTSWRLRGDAFEEEEIES
ncbi:M67 family peptidase [Crenobacter cavernae]|uniref:M67 family peptidase n=1 Tax=Crenobacter cavernae TaxID=2290923 RepID=A0ABY0FB69_9NEIS|nr:M67 family peptidase [Crenobacter cavernae]